MKKVKNKQMFSAEQIIQKRKELWQETQDIKKDSEFVEAVACELLENSILRKQICNNPEFLIEMCFVVVDKKKNTVPLFLNEVQKDFINRLNESIEKYRSGKITEIKFAILKGRQQGFTTLITNYQLACTITRKNFTGFTIADSTDNTGTIFQDKAKFTYNQLPEILKPTEAYNNKRELLFDKLNSSWRIATATKEVGRSKTINFFHGSEAGFWEVLISDIQSAIGEALTQDAIQILESTANGFNEFKDIWDSDKWINCFYEWWRTEEYSTKFESKEIKEQFINNIANKQDWIWERLRWLRDKKLLDNTQLYWYYKKWDNYLNKDKIKQEYPCTPEEAFLASGNCVFDKEIVIQRKNELFEYYKEKPFRRGFFKYKWNNEETKDKILDESIEFVNNPLGYINLYEEPKLNVPYVIGGDTKGEGSDFFTATVINNNTNKRVATLREQLQPDIYTQQMYCLGKFYNTALIGIEINFDLYPVIELKRLQYPFQYKREEFDIISKKTKEKFGWKTDGNTRPIIISTEMGLIRDHPEYFTDLVMLDECLSFVYDKDMRPDAMSGKHDDLLFSDMIAHACRIQQKSNPQSFKKLEGYYTPTELEDLGYKNNTTPIKNVNSQSLARRRRK